MKSEFEKLNVPAACKLNILNDSNLKVKYFGNKTDNENTIRKD